MTMFGSQWLANAGASYEIEQSIRFDNVDGVLAGGAQMFRLALTGTPTNTKKATISAWVKRATLGYNQVIAYSGDPNGSTSETLRFNTNNTMTFGQASSDYVLITTQVFRDVGAWYHIVAEIDTANGTSADRANLYVNGTKVTSFSTENYPTENYVTNWTATSSSIAHTWGTNGIPAAGPSSQLFAGYMADMYVLDGEKAGASSFGETNDDGVWIPTAYSGSFGNNGYYMTGGNASALGEDFSGNNLDFTTVALASTDQMLDTPTNNWCVWNNIDTSFNNNVTSDGNLVITTASPGYTRFQLGTIGVSSGKWEWKWTPTASLSDGGIGVDDGTSQAATGASNGAISSQSANGFIYRSGGTKCVGGTASSYGATFAADDVIRCQIDLDADTPTIEFFKNDASQGSINMNAGVTYFPCQFSADAGLVTVADFGQSGFTAAAGFNALNTANLATPSITDGSAHFQPTLYTGTSSALEVDQSGNSTFTPDLAWIKSRSGSSNQVWIDSVRGVSKQLYSNATAAEATAADGLTSFDADGFTLGDDSGDYVNIASANMVAWQWKANGSGSSNEDGSINTTATSANTTAGFSIIEWSGTGANGTIGHGLGVQPLLYIIKNTATTNSWTVGSTLFANTKYLVLNSTDAPVTGTAWNSAYPTSSVINLGDSAGSNGSGTNNMICYAFAEVPGYSSFGSYTGNGSTDGVFVYTGFTPAFIMYKVTSTTDSWEMYDTKRRTFNPYGTQLKANLSNAETDDTRIDILSNGFKARSTNTAVNGSGATYIYMAFAENPFGGDGVAPATAR